MQREPNDAEPDVTANAEELTPSVVDFIERDGFMRSVKRAELEAIDANRTRDELELWAQRLLPYFERDPHVTVADALQLYHRDRLGGSPPRGDC